MKKIVSVVFLIFVFSTFIFADNSTIEIINQNSASITLKCTVENFHEQLVNTANGNEVIITLDNGTSILEAGTPDLPKLTTSLIIPNKANMAVVVASSTFTDYPNVQVAPSKGNLYRNINPAEIPYEYGIPYQVDDFFPENRAALRDPYIFRNFRGQTVVINPIAYNPVTKILRVYHELIIKVVEVEGQPINAFTPKKDKIVTQFDELYKKRFLNYHANQYLYPQLSELGDMLIISGSQYMDQMADFVDWKNRKGIKTKIVDIATIGNSIEAIHNFLDIEYATTDLTYLLLVGDENDIVTDQAYDDNACDNCYGYRDGDDHFSEIFVGRFNGENATHIQTMIDRTMEYEMNPMPGDWLTTSVGVASNLGPGDDGEYDFEHMNNIKSELLAYHYEDVYEFYQGSNDEVSPTPGDPTADAPSNPNSTMILDVFNTQGASLFNYAGHGDHAVLLTGNFDNNAIDAMTNTGMYPFLIAVACCTGDFEGDFGAGDCLGDRWIRATDMDGNPTGGIGGCFSSILQTWVPPMEGQDEMTKLITESAQYNIRHTLGGIVIHGCGSMIDDYGMDGESMMDTWNIFGDPSVVLRTDHPSEIEVTHLPAISIGTSELTFNCNVADAMIALYYQNEIIGTGFVAGGAVTIDFQPVLFPDQIKVTATAYNHYPYQGTVDVIATEGPFLVLNNMEVQDPTGNNNGELDFGESILLDVSLKNVGVELSPMVNAAISTSDNKVSLVDTNENYGDILEDEILFKESAFNFTVSSFVEDQHEVNFSLDLADDNGNEWVSSFSFTINAPQLSLSNFVIDDEVGGNGDGRFNSGEEVEVRIYTANNGHADSPFAIGVLETTSPYLTITDNSVDLGVVEKNGGVALATFNIQVDANAPISESFELMYSTTAANYVINTTHENAINIIVADDFETGDFSNESWTSEGAAAWFVTTEAPAVGAYCSQSGNITNNEATEMILTLNIVDDGHLVFNRKVSSESGFDFLEFYIDNVLIEQWSGLLDWEVVSFPISAGQRTFKWVYVKDATQDFGEDAAWIDEVILSPFEVSVNTKEQTALEFSVDTNPNPFFNNTTVSISLKTPSHVSASVFNLTGIKVSELLNEENLATGTHTFEAIGQDLPRGLYLLNLQIDGQTITKKLVKQ